MRELHLCGPVIITGIITATHPLIMNHSPVNIMKYTKWEHINAAYVVISVSDVKANQAMKSMTFMHLTHLIGSNVFYANMKNNQKRL